MMQRRTAREADARTAAPGSRMRAVPGEPSGRDRVGRVVPERTPGAIFLTMRRARRSTLRLESSGSICYAILIDAPSLSIPSGPGCRGSLLLLGRGGRLALDEADRVHALAPF